MMLRPWCVDANRLTTSSKSGHSTAAADDDDEEEEEEEDEEEEAPRLIANLVFLSERCRG